MYGYTYMFSQQFLQRETTFIILCCFTGWHSPSNVGSTLKGKNLLLRSKFIKSGPPVRIKAKFVKMAELLPLKVCIRSVGANSFH